jgi:hypothetical protein
MPRRSARGRWILAEAAARRPAPDAAAAREHYGAATALATELGMEPLLAACQAGISSLEAGRR